MKLINHPESEASSDEDLSEDGGPTSTKNHEEEESDEVNDSEDFVEERENFADTKIEILHRVSLGRANRKIILKKTAADKPTIQKVVDEAIEELNEKGGSSVEAIRKFIIQKNLGLSESHLKLNIKRYIQNCLTDGTMVQIKRSFKFTKKHGMKKKQKEQQKFKTKKANQEAGKTNKKPAAKNENIGKKTKAEIKEIKKVINVHPEKPATKNLKLKKDVKKTTDSTNTDKTILKAEEPHKSKSESDPIAITTDVKASGRGKKK